MASAEVKPAGNRPEERMAGLEGNAVLGRTSPHHAHHQHHHQSSNAARRSSYEAAAPAFSPHESTWPTFGFGVDGSTVGTGDPPLHSFFNLPPGSSSVPSSVGIPSATFSPQNGWPTHEHSGECTPTTGFGFTNGPEATAFGPTPSATSAAGFDPVVMPHAGPISAGFAPTSPQHAKDGWFAANTEGVDFQMPAQPTPLSQPFATSTHVLRRDGIRKKNARFEIPAERNLRTIDQLINQTTDEAEIKELKQQKRLLRNRQAALDSRQRKKQHTERLEEEKKHYTTMISELEEALGDMKAQETEWHRQKEQWAAAHQHYQGCIEQFMLEKEELIRRHTIETGELRKKNAMLVEQLQRLEQNAMSAAPSSAGFSANYPDFDPLAVSNWEDFTLPSEFSLEADPRSETAAPGPPKKDMTKPAAPGNDDKAVTSSFLLMLLLCGAWVVSNSAKAPTDLLPVVPDEMKTASAAVLESLYKDSGIPPPVETTQHLGRVSPNGFEMASLSQSSLETLHRRLVAPSEQQMHEQAFSMTPRQYNDLTTGLNGGYAPDYGPSVGEALTAEPPPTKFDGSGSVGSTSGTTAETYTRSLLKGRVSAHVLKDFARMVQATRQPGPGAVPWKTEPIS